VAGHASAKSQLPSSQVAFTAKLAQPPENQINTVQSSSSNFLQLIDSHIQNLCKNGKDVKKLFETKHYHFTRSRKSLPEDVFDNSSSSDTSKSREIDRLRGELVKVKEKYRRAKSKIKELEASLRTRPTVDGYITPMQAPTPQMKSTIEVNLGKTPSSLLMMNRERKSTSFNSHHRAVTSIINFESNKKTLKSMLFDKIHEKDSSETQQVGRTSSADLIKSLSRLKSSQTPTLVHNYTETKPFPSSHPPSFPYSLSPPFSTQIDHICLNKKRSLVMAIPTEHHRGLRRKKRGEFNASSATGSLLRVNMGLG